MGLAKVGVEGSLSRPLQTAGPGQEARTAVLATQQSLLVSVQSHQEESGNWLCCITWTYVEGGRGDCSFLFV